MGLPILIAGRASEDLPKVRCGQLREDHSDRTQLLCQKLILSCMARPFWADHGLKTLELDC